MLEQAPWNRPIVAAVVQLTSTQDERANAITAEAQIQRAADAGAELIALPENLAWLRTERGAPAPAEPLDGPRVERFREIARRRCVGLWLGSLPEASSDPQRPYNTSVLIDPDGALAGVYRKIHLFDIEIPGRESHRESATVTPGHTPVVARWAGAPVGMSVCYDLRFPELYRALVDGGAAILGVPAAFTYTTGRAHWLALLRARAIENQCWVLAPGQWGRHGGGRRSFGCSAIIDPWGAVAACLPAGVGFAMATLDPARVAAVRAQIPCLDHRRIGRPGPDAGAV